jgi:tyrosine-protein kinase
MSEFGTDPTLRSYFMAVRRRKWWLIAVAMLGMGISLSISVLEPKQYAATAQLLVQSSGPAVSLGGVEQEPSTTYVQTELQLVTSAPVLLTVREKLGITPPVSAVEVGQTDVISLTAVSSIPARAALIANTYAAAFVSHTQSVAIASITTAESELQTQVASLERQIKSLQTDKNATAEVAALANQEVVLKEEIAQVQVNGAVSASGVEFVTPAQAPVSPSSPKPTQNALLGLAAGLVLGLAAAFLRDSLDEALTSKEATERIGGVPVLALVPMVSTWKKRDQPEVVVAAAPSSPHAEAYRSLRTSLQFARQERDLRTLLVTSPAAAEGKTSTLANLGAAFAQAGERVVLVSCDLRRPRLGRFFGLAEDSGFTTVLLGQQTLGEVMQQVPGYDCLWLLGTGPVPSNPAELLNGSQARKIFARLREEFDLVLVDSPPVLPVTDAMVLSTYADGTLVVVAAGQTTRTELHRTAERFAQAKAHVLGIVLNEVTKQNGYGGGYGYGYAYTVAAARSLSRAHANGSAHDSVAGSRHAQR